MATVVTGALCGGCLVAGRTLAPLSNPEHRQYYSILLAQGGKEQGADVELCWECRSDVRRCVRFRDTARSCHRLFTDYYTQDAAVRGDIARAPRLSVHAGTAVEVPWEAAENTQADKKEIFMEVEMELVELPPVKCESEPEPPWPAGGRSGESHVKKEEPLSDYDDKECLFPSDDSDNLAQLECEVRAYMRGDKHKNVRGDKHKKKKSKLNKENKKEKMLASIARANKKRAPVRLKRRPRKHGVDDKIRTLELSHEEMLAERARDARREAYVRADYKCVSCLVGFSYHKSYTEHLQTRHDQSRGDYSCPICKTVMSSVESFTAHYKRHLRRYECTACGKRTMDRKVMSQHYVSAHETSSVKEYKCHCGKISHSLDAHRYHKDTHKSRVECVECDKTFSHRAGLMNHRLSVHKLNNMFPCTLCDKVFRWKASLKKHLERHERKFRPPPDAPYCEPCGVSFSSVCTYQRHMKNSLKHVTENELKFICADCNRKFSNKTKLRDHIEEKHLHKTYQCHICSKPSKNRVCLDQHIRNVHRGRPNNKMCHHCGKGFPTKVQLESHIRSHTGERPFICEYCPTTFSQQSNLYKHNRQVHLNIKAKRYPPLCRKRKDKPPPPAPGAAPAPPPPPPHLMAPDMYHLVM